MMRDPIKKLEILRDWNQECNSKFETNNKEWPQFNALMKSIGELFEKNVEKLDVIIKELEKKKVTKSLKESIQENDSYLLTQEYILEIEQYVAEMKKGNLKTQSQMKAKYSLKESILENATEWINKTELWRKTKSDKKRCFDAINYLVKENFLETKKVGNMHMLRRRNSDGNFGEKNAKKN